VSTPGEQKGVSPSDLALKKVEKETRILMGFWRGEGQLKHSCTHVGQENPDTSRKNWSEAETVQKRTGKDTASHQVEIVESGKKDLQKGGKQKQGLCFA